MYLSKNLNVFVQIQPKLGQLGSADWQEAKKAYLEQKEKNFLFYFSPWHNCGMYGELWLSFGLVYNSRKWRSKNWRRMYIKKSWLVLSSWAGNTATQWLLQTNQWFSNGRWHDERASSVSQWLPPVPPVPPSPPHSGDCFLVVNMHELNPVTLNTALYL